MRPLSWVAGLAALCACGDGDSDPDFSLGGAEFHVDFDLDSGPDQCPSAGTLQVVQTGSQLTGTLGLERPDIRIAPVPGLGPLAVDGDLRGQPGGRPQGIQGQDQKTHQHQWAKESKNRRHQLNPREQQSY